MLCKVFISSSTLPSDSLIIQSANISVGCWRINWEKDVQLSKIHAHKILEFISLRRAATCKSCRPDTAFTPLIGALLACVALLVSGSLLAAPDLEGGNVTTGPGQEVSIPVNFTADGSVVALQFDLTYDATVLSPTAMTAGTALVGHSFDWQQVQPGRLRFIITAGVQTLLVDGSLLDLGLLAADTASAGNYPLVISNVILSNGTAQRIAATGIVDGSVVIEFSPAPAIPVPTLGPVAIVLLILLIAGFILVIHQRGFGGITLSVFLGMALFSSTIARAVTLPGDANNDGVVDANDVPAIVAQILERADAPGDPDCNEDGAVDVLDIICVQQVSAPPPPPGQNSAPDLVPPGNRSLQADRPFETPIFATDPDVGDVLTFSLPTAPAGMSIHPSSGILSWSPGAGDLGVNNVTAMVMDSGGLTDSEVFSVEVFQPRVEAPANVAPVLVVPGDQGLVFNTLLGIQASATDADVGDTLTFELINAPSGMSIDPATGAITWTPTEVQIGEHDVAVRVTDTAGAVDVGSFIVTVNDINKPPVAVDELYTVHRGETLTIPVSGVLQNDSDPNGDAMSAVLVSNPANGSVTLNADGSFVYQPFSPLSNLEDTPVQGDMMQLAEPVTFGASSSLNSGFAATHRNAFRVSDGDLNTSWFTSTGDAVNLGASPFFEASFGVAVTVTEIQMFGNRESADGFDFLSGIFQLFDKNNVELFNSGDLSLAAPDRDVIVAVPSIEQVRRIRFTPTADESARPGFAELKVMGSAVTRLFKRKSNVDLTHFSRVVASASSFKDTSKLYKPENAIDRRFISNWYSENGDAAPSFQVTFPDQDVTVREIQMFGATNSVNQPLSQRQFLSGEFRLLDRAGVELWSSGVVTLTGVETGYTVPVPVVANVHTVRFEGATWNSSVVWPGISEFKILGDGLVWPIYPGEKWSWTETSMPVEGISPARHVVNTPVVVDLDADGFPEIVFSAAVPREGSSRFPAYIVVLDGRTGAEKQVLADPAMRVEGYVALAAGDIDGDGLPEIVGMAYKDARPYHLIAFENDLTFKWRSDEVEDVSWAGITIANLDGTGLPEILVGHQVLDADGKLLWSGSSTASGRAIPIVADIDLDGAMEVITGNRVYAADGTVLWSAPGVAATWGWAATGNFDDDPFAEVVFGTHSSILVFEHDGTLKWETKNVWAGGPPTVADFDGDGQAEIGQAGDRLYSVFDTDGQLMWEQPIEDSSGSTGSSVFDFDGDGSMEVIHHDHKFVRIFRGSDGELLFKTPLTGPTAVEYPVIADIDADGHAELLVTSAALGGYEDQSGIRVYGGLDNDWIRTRKIWNQHAYHVTNVNSDGTIPVSEQPNWLTPGLNNYRQNAFAIDDPDRLDSFTYVAHAAGQDSNIATVSVDVLTPNTAPVFVSTPDTTATVDYAYLHGLQARDAEFDPILFELITGPVGMTIDPPTGLLRWSPGVGELGAHAVTVKVSDDAGLSSLQSYTLTVGNVVIVPDVVGNDRTTAESLLSAEGLNTGSVTAFNHASIPAGSVSRQIPIGGAVTELGDRVNLVISLGPVPEDIDDDGDSFTENQGDCNDVNNTIFPGATDIPANGIDEDCDGVDASRPPAQILVLPATATILTDEVLSLSAIGIFDDGTSQNITAIASWSDGPEFSSSTPGNFVVTATRGVSGLASIDVVARIGGDVLPPVAEITTPVADSTVTEPVDIIGTATDANFLKYTIGIAPAGEPNFTEITNSTTQVTDDVLGRFDPTLLINDLYTIRLTVFDTGGNQAIAETMVQVDENLKVGNFSLSFTDLQIPMAGIPITVTRTYDSRDKQMGDFGVGWRLDVKTLRLRTNRVLGTGWEVVRSGLAFFLLPTDAHKVSLTLPGGRVEEFDLVISPTVSPLTPFPPLANRASYAPRPGTLGSLESLDNNNLSILDGQPGEIALLDDLTNNAYNPQRFKYTTADGSEIIIHKSAGVESIRDANGNTLTFTPGAIVHSAGRSILFQRDTSGRITQLTDPNGNIQTYTYDGNGDLTGHTDSADNTTQFTYNHRHGLLQVIDPLDRPVMRNEYSAEGRLTKSTNSDGRIVTFAHNINARQELVTDVDGSITAIEYDERGNVLSTTDPLGNITSSTYDASGNPLTITNAEGETTIKTYDSRNNMLSSTDPLGNTTSLSYDSNDRLTSITNANGGTQSFTYDARGNLLARTNALGIFDLKGVYDVNGNMLVSTDALGNTTQLDYDVAGNLTRSVDPRGNSNTYTYDANGNPSTTVNSLGNTTTFVPNSRNLNNTATSPMGAKTILLYGATGLPRSITDPLGGTATQNFDAAGKLLSFTDALGNQSNRAFDIKGNLIATTNRASHVETMQYDAADRLVKKTEADGATTQTRYDKVGRIIEKIDARGNSLTYEYDAGGRNTRVSNALSIDTRYEYDSLGNRIGMTDANGNVFRFDFDALSRLIKTTFPDGSFETSTYDDAGRKIKQTDALGHTTLFTYDANDNLTRVTDALGQQTQFSYDAQNNLLAQTDARGNSTSFTYNADNRRISKTYPDGAIQTTLYDATGNITATTDPNGNQTLQLFDANGQLLSTTFPDGSQETHTYTLTGQIATSTNDLGTVTYSYDANDRLSRLANPDGSSIDYTYDLAGNRTGVSTRLAALAAPRLTIYTYDVLNRLESVTDAEGNTTVYSYDLIGNVASISYPNGVVTIFTYNDRSHLVLVSHSRGATELARYAYQVNAVGDRTRVTHTDGSYVEYEYDALRRLTRETYRSFTMARLFEMTYTYDAVGNRTRTLNLAGVTTVYQYDNTDKLLSAGTTSYSYDANGNVQSRADVTGLTNFTFNFENELTSVSTPAAELAYRYDAQGLLVRRTEATMTTRFLVDPASTTGVSQVLSEYDASATQTAEYTFGHQILSQNRGGARHYYHQDASRNVRLLTDSAGNASDTYNYQAFGPELSRAGTTVNPYQFAGDRFESASGLLYLRARFYDPATGRFISRDPYTGTQNTPVSLHRYLYANANPITFVDPSGRVPTLASVLIAVQIVALVAEIYFALDGNQKAEDTFFYIGLVAGLGSLALIGKQIVVNSIKSGIKITSVKGAQAAAAAGFPSVATKILGKLNLEYAELVAKVTAREITRDAFEAALMQNAKAVAARALADRTYAVAARTYLQNLDKVMLRLVLGRQKTLYLNVINEIRPAVESWKLRPILLFFSS